MSTDLPLLTAVASFDLKYRADIDGLRAIAVSSIVIFHVFPTHLTGGFIGVDIFFVISGYLISSIIYHELETGSFSFVQFYSRRIRRIFPSLTLILVVCYVAGWYSLNYVDYNKLASHIVAASTFSSNFILYSESDYFDSDSRTKPLLHLWSLAIEEQFYLFWPVLVYILWEMKGNFLVVTIGLALCSFTLNVVYIERDRVQTFYWPTMRAWELLIGACLAFQGAYTNTHLEAFGRRLASSFIGLKYNALLQSICVTPFDVMSIFGVLLILLPMWLLTEASLFPGWWALAPTLGTGVLIFVGPIAWINKTILSSYLFVKVGLISYPLYLWHWPILVFTNFQQEPLNSYRTQVKIVILSLCAALLTSICIERPFRFGKYLKIKTVFLSVLMVCIGFVGYQTYRAGGLPNRFPSTIPRMIDYKSLEQISRKAYRLDLCHLSPTQNELNFGECVDNVREPALTAVVLWGDSTAAHLYPGIKALKPTARLTQLTTNGCPPILFYSFPTRPHCQGINAYVAKRIAREKPNTVILASTWYTHKGEALNETVAFLKNSSIENIYIVGPPPQWRQILAVCLHNYHLNHSSQEIPSRMRVCLEPLVQIKDRYMEVFALKYQVKYISLYKILCNQDGCLTHVGSNMTAITSFDTHHFTVAGSIYVVSRFPEALRQSLSKNTF